jgi:hypothetical protein
MCDHERMMERPDEQHIPFDEEDEAPPDALPASPGLRKVAIAIYILIVFCVVGGLLLSLVWSGILADRWSIPLPDRWSV